MTFNEIMETAYNAAGPRGQEILMNASQLAGVSAELAAEWRRTYPIGSVEKRERVLEGLVRSRKKAERDFVKFFRPNKYGEYA